MKNKKKILKELEWDKKEVYEADAKRVQQIIKKKGKSSKIAAFYEVLDKVRIKL